MSHVPAGQRALIAESLLLIPDTVSDLADFTARPGHYLVSIDADPEAAAALWFNRRARLGYGSDGVLRLRYHSLELIPGDLWDDVTGTWFALLDALEGYLRTGAGTGSLSGQPVQLELQRLGRFARFSVNGIRHVLDPDDVIPGILAEARRYFTWVHEVIGEGQQQAFARLAELEPLAAAALSGSTRSGRGSTTGQLLRERVAAEQAAELAAQHAAASTAVPGTALPANGQAHDLQDLRVRRSVPMVQGRSLTDSPD